jgi:hypothetical protein
MSSLHYAVQELELHEVDCVYRNINCPFLNCNDNWMYLSSVLANIFRPIESWRARSNDFVPNRIRDKCGFLKSLPFVIALFSLKFIMTLPRYPDTYFYGTPEETVPPTGSRSLQRRR